jgi:predicted ArsR family transcriptional regulator
MSGDSRQRVIEILKRRGEASVTDLSRALGLTPVTIRHHLDALMEERVVSQPTSRRKPGPGRPEMVFSLTQKADDLTPRNYGELCACLLSTLSETAVDSNWLLASTGRRLFELASPHRKRSGVAAVMAFLEGRGYFPSHEHSESGSTIVLSNCPYLEAARSFPEICRMDIALISRMVGGEVIAESSIARNDPGCRMRLPRTAAI